MKFCSHLLSKFYACKPPTLTGQTQIIKTETGIASAFLFEYAKKRTFMYDWLDKKFKLTL